MLNPREKRRKPLHGIYCTSQILKQNVISVEKTATGTVYGMFWNKNVPTGIEKYKYTDFRCCDGATFLKTVVFIYSGVRIYSVARGI